MMKKDLIDLQRKAYYLKGLVETLEGRPAKDLGIDLIMLKALASDALRDYEDMVRDMEPTRIQEMRTELKRTLQEWLSED